VATYRDLPSIQTLRCFEAAARLGSFAAAAEELCMTQSAVNHQLRALADSVGQELFERQGNRMVLTVVGRSLAVETQRALDYLAQAYSVAAPETTDKSDGVHLALQSALVSNWLLPNFADLRSTVFGGGLRVSSIPDLSSNVPPDVDVVLIYGRGDMADILVEKVSEEIVFPVCSPDFLARHPDLTLETMNAHPLLLHSGATWNLWLEKAQLPISYPEKAIYFDDVTFTINGALLGYGIAMARGTLVRHHLAAGRLIAPFDLTVPGMFSYYLGWKSESVRRKHLVLRSKIYDSFAAARCAVKRIA